MSDRTDVVLVGGGIAGSSLAVKLAERGLECVVLERTEHFEDRVRGEWMAPWGVAEAKRLGLYQLLLELGGHHLRRHIGYDELLPPEAAEAGMLPLGEVHPDAPGPLCIEHVVLQQGLLDAAARAGAEVVRGARGIRVEAGDAPSVEFDTTAGRRHIGCRLVVGADGRSSEVRRQLGIALVEDPVDHLIAGLLVEGAVEWPEDLQMIGKAGDSMLLVFPQGGGRVRLYVDYGLEDRGRFSGARGAEAFLACFEHACLPGGDRLARAKPAGPCRSFPSQDAWTETPVAPGAILVGDAAGYNDPIIGQGLSIALRDVRTVSELMADDDEWKPALFEPYARERRERLRRLRRVAQFMTSLNARFDDEGVARRQRAMARLAERPELGMQILGGAYAGPEVLPDSVMEEGALEALFS